MGRTYVCRFLHLAFFLHVPAKFAIHMTGTDEPGLKIV